MYLPKCLLLRYSLICLPWFFFYLLVDFISMSRYQLGKEFFDLISFLELVIPSLLWGKMEIERLFIVQKNLQLHLGARVWADSLNCKWNKYPIQRNQSCFNALPTEVSGRYWGVLGNKKLLTYQGTLHSKHAHEKLRHYAKRQ